MSGARVRDVAIWFGILMVIIVAGSVYRAHSRQSNDQNCIPFVIAKPPTAR